jgi:pimeloyl-ACP methyl ester carboxylesterase
MGGMLAQCFLRLYPDKVGRLILANSMAPNKDYAARVDRSNQRALKFPMWLIRFASVRSLAKHLETVPISEREFWKAYFKEAIYSGWSHESIARQNQCLLDYMLNYEFKPGELDWMADRVLVIASDDDKAIPPELSAALRDLYPGARLHVFHNAGHVPLITKREEYVALIREFLSKGL